MDRLLTLQPKVSVTANSQAEAVCSLLEKAHTERASHAVFSAAEGMHPLVMQVLVSKGYVVEEMKGGTFGYAVGTNKEYRIT